MRGGMAQTHRASAGTQPQCHSAGASVLAARGGETRTLTYMYETPRCRSSCHSLNSMFNVTSFHWDTIQ